MSVLAVVPMTLRDRFEAWVERILPYTDPARSKRHAVRWQRQLTRSRRVQSDAAVVIAESRTAREHMRGSYQRADERLARR